MSTLQIPRIIAICILFVAVLFSTGCTPQGDTNTDPIADTSSDGSDSNQSGLEFLEGKWIRVGINHPSSDFMKVDVTGDTGTITDKAASGFSNGAVKWKSITSSGSGSYSYQELGSDGNYYPSNISVVSDDELRIQVVHSGAGNAQRWLRDDGTIEEGNNFNGGSLATLEGTWIRVESNNPTSDLMKINVSGAAGQIVDKAGSNFNNGDVKWNMISGGTDATFSYQELGSDYNYYPATIAMVSDNELSISVGSSGAGNSQKWVRDDGTIAASPDQELPCTINEDMTLVDTPADPDYVVDANCVVDITAKLTVDPGVTIEFGRNSGFGIYDDGELLAAGTPDARITMKGATAEAGYWRGIHTERAATLKYVDISDAGSNYVYCCNEVAAVFAKDGRLLLEQTTIRNSDNLGLFVRDTDLSGYGNNTITDNREAPAKMTLETLRFLDGMQSDYSGNDVEYIRVANAPVREATAIDPTNVPFLFEGKVFDITVPLTIRAGVDIRFEENGGLGVYDAGSMRILGSADKPVIIRGQQARRGFWRGIHTEASSVIRFAEISHAGANYVYCCNEKAAVFAKDGSLKLQDTKISESAVHGLYVGKNANLSGYKRNRITGNGSTPIYMAAESARFLDGANSDYSGNNIDFVQVYSSQIDTVVTMRETNVPYLLDGFVLDVKKPLVMNAGVDIRFKENGGIGVYDEGALTVRGTASNPIQIKGESDVPGFWRGIHIETNSSGNVIRHLNLANAGGNYVYCCNAPASLFLKGANVTVENTTLSRGEAHGMYLLRDTRLTYAKNRIESHEDSPIYLLAEQVGSLDGTGSDYVANDKNYIEVGESSIRAATRWRKAKVPYLIDGKVLDITEGLTIDAGAELVFEDGGGLGIYDNGFIKSEGTSSNKIIFRGYENVPGFWRGIHVETNSTSNILAHASIRNAGSNYVYCCNDKAALMLKAGRISVNNSEIRTNNGCGIHVKAGATLTESGNTFAANADGHICN